MGRRLAFLLMALRLSAPLEAQLLPDVQLQFFKDTGNAPAANGFLCTTATGGSTSQLTYQDTALTTPNANPITLNAAGRPVFGGNEVAVFLQGLTYRITLYAAGTGNTCNGTTVGSLIRQVDGVADQASLFKTAFATQLDDKVCHASQYTGTNPNDWGGKVVACYNALPSTGGTIDTRGLEGTQSASATITFSKPIHLILSCGTITSSVTPAFTIASTNVEIEGGCQAQGSKIVVTNGDGFNFSIYTTYGSIYLHDFALDGGSGTTRRAFYQAGDDSTADELYGVNIARILATNWNIGIATKTTRNWWIHENWFQNINSCMVALGQNFVWRVNNNQCIRASGNGSGNSDGIKLGYATYNSGATSVKPEGIQITENQFNGFTTTCVNVDAAIFVNVTGNDCMSLATGFRWGEIAGVLNVRNNYSEIHTSSGVAAYLAVNQSSVNPDAKINVEGNKGITDGTTTSAACIAIGTSDPSNQPHTVIRANHCSTFTSYDLTIFGAGYLNIAENSFRSTALAASIYFQTTLITGAQVEIENNTYLAGYIKAAASQKAHIHIGYNGGIYTTCVDGKTAIANGTGAAGVSTTFQSLLGNTVGSTPAFASLGNTGFDIVLTIKNSDNAAVQYRGTTSTTGVTIYTSANVGADTNVWWNACMVYPPY